jgi:hypothetical protein
LLQQILNRPTHSQEPESESELSLEGAGNHALLLRKEVEATRSFATRANTPDSKVALDSAVSARDEFWIDTCRDPAHMKNASVPAMTLYRLHGCRFEAPTREHVQEVLSALDKALPTWDKEHPELFYQTLELNFRELVRS